MQDYQDKEERKAIIEEIRRRFSIWSNVNYSLDQLRRIRAILNESNEQNQ